MTPAWAMLASAWASKSNFTISERPVMKQEPTGPQRQTEHSIPNTGLFLDVFDQFPKKRRKLMKNAEPSTMTYYDSISGSR